MKTLKGVTGDLLFFSNKGALTYLVDLYGENVTFELFGIVNNEEN